MRKFVRTRRRRASPPSPSPPPPPPPAPHLAPSKTNGHANGAGEAAAAARGDCPSTLASSSWSGSQSEAAGGGAGAGGALWEDPEFPATWRALGDRKYRDVVWLRPHELCAAPRFRGDGALAAPEPPPEPADRFAARWRVAAGGAGVPALGAAAGALALTPRLLSRAAPHQSFRHRYTGAFTFRLWVWGAWREVAVDDRLPAAPAPAPRLLASRSALRDDFTLPLLEKAYAKLHGSYRAARRDGGGAAGALRALAGGAVQAAPLRAAPHAAPLLLAAAPRATLLLLEPHQETGAAWAVTGVARARRGEVLVCVRAVGAPPGPAPPPGAPAPAAWAALPAAERDLLAQRTQHPAEIWLSPAELAGAFVRLVAAHVGPDEWRLEPALAARAPWRLVLARRRWRAHYNAGGPPHAATAGANPQFQLEVGARCHVVVSVLQQYAPGAGAGAGAGRAPAAVGAALYALGAARARPGELPPRARPLPVSHAARALEVVSFCALPAGRYLVVAHGARAPPAAAAFLLRLYTDAHASVWEVNDDNLVLRNIADEEEEEGAPPLPRAMRAALHGILSAKLDDELEAEEVRAVVRARWRWCLDAPPSRELARALAAGGEPRLEARLPAARLAPRCRALRAWRAAWRREARGCGGAGGAPALRLRPLLRACGAACSNKVAEALVAVHAPRGRLPLERFLRALLQLHLAHERHRQLDARLQASPLSLEEMILMTIYS